MSDATGSTENAAMPTVVSSSICHAHRLSVRIRMMSLIWKKSLEISFCCAFNLALFVAIGIAGKFYSHSDYPIMPHVLIGLAVGISTSIGYLIECYLYESFGRRLPIAASILVISIFLVFTIIYPILKT